MKKIKFLAIISIIFLLSQQCLAQKTPKVAYVFPNEMAADIQAQYKEMADKGLILYQLTCAKCHNEKVKGKEIIPDFSLEQLEAYQIRMSNTKHEAELSDAKLNTEELSLITTFFMYKKPNEGRRK